MQQSTTSEEDVYRILWRKIVMKKRTVEVKEVANVVNEKLKKGIFLTSKSGDKVNSMVIGWGHIGRVWERPVFIAYVCTSRYTICLYDS